MQIEITQEEGEALAERCEGLLEDNAYDWQLDQEEHDGLVDFWVDLIARLDPNKDVEVIREAYQWVEG